MGQVLGAALLFGAVGLIAKSLVQGGPTGDPDWSLSNRDRVAAVLIGIFGGFIVGLTSVGSGVFFGLTLLVIFPLRAHKVVGTDIFHAAILLYVAGAAHWAAGNIDFGDSRLAPARLDPRRAHRRAPDALDPRAAASAPARRRARPGRHQAARRSLRGNDRRGRARRRGGRRSSCGSRATAGSASSAAARVQPPRSSSIASRGDAHGLGELRHDRPRLPRGGCGRRRGDRGRRHAARPDRPEPIRSVLVRRGRPTARGGADRDAGRERARDRQRHPQARAGTDLRRRLVAARPRSVHRAGERGRLRDAPDTAPAAPRPRADPVGDPHRARANGRDALRDRRCDGRLRVDRRPGHARHRA